MESIQSFGRGQRAAIRSQEPRYEGAKRLTLELIWLLRGRLVNSLLPTFRVVKLGFQFA
jgi:hypothetical protein